MCKFHKDIARAIATNPETGEFDAGQYAVALVSMFPRLEQYIPEMFGCDGFVPKQMASDEVQRLFETSQPLQAFIQNADGSLKSLEEIKTSEEQYREEHLGILRRAMLDIAARHDLSEKGLHFPDYRKHYIDGYRETCCAPPDPRQNGPFLDVAVVHAYEGYREEQVAMASLGTEWDGEPEYFAERALTIRDDVPAPDQPEIKGYHLGPIMDAVRDYHAIPGVREVIEKMFCHTVARIFKSAPEDLANGIGFSETYGCAMCGSAGKAFQEAVGRNDDGTEPQPVPGSEPC